MAVARKASDFVTTAGTDRAKGKVVELSEHLDSTQWTSWPVRSAVAPTWGVRQRQVEAALRKGVLTLYRCPDHTLRLDPSQCTEQFGEPGLFQGRERDVPMVEKAERQLSRAAEKEREAFKREVIDDPLAGMFKVVCEMLTDLRSQQKDLFELMTKPIAKAQSERDEVMDRLLTRLETLEARELEQLALVGELSDMKHARELATQEAANRQVNRQAVIGQFKEHWPALVQRFLVGPNPATVLGGFVNGLKPDIQSMLAQFSESLISSGELSAEQAAILRAALPVQKTTSGANGAPRATS